MDKKILKQLQPILLDIFAKKQNIYKTKYQTAGIEKKDITNLTETIFKKLPSITQKELAKAPYKTRFLEEKPGLNKLILSQEANTYFLVHRNLEEIKKANLPLQGSRPLVLMQDVYEAIEHCLFFYEHKILPLIGEILNPAIVYATAKQYQIDSLFIDHQSIALFQTELLKLSLPLQSVTIIDSFLSKEDLLWPKNIQLQAIVSIPEFGRIAYACPQALKKKTFIFHPYNDVFLEPAKKTYVTSTRLKACPMIRYKSNVTAEETITKCQCKKASYLIHQ